MSVQSDNSNLEQIRRRLNLIEIKLGSMEQTVATREDLHKELRNQNDKTTERLDSQTHRIDLQYKWLIASLLTILGSLLVFGSRLLF